MNATIQARADYRSKFGNYRYRIEIVDSEEAAQIIRAFEVTPQGAVISYEGDEENAFQPIVSTTCQFTLVCTTQDQVNFLRSVAQSDSGRYGVRVLRNNGTSEPVAVFWVGTILADQLSFQDMLPQLVTVTATDDLGYLQEKPYLQDDGTRYEGVVSVTEHVLNCIGHLRTGWHWDYFITIVSTDYYPVALSMGKNLLPGNYASAGASVDLYDESRISHAGFHELDSEDKAKSAYYVLEEIAKHFNGQFFFTYATQGVRLVFQPVGAQIQYADDSTQVEGFTYRSDGLLFTLTPLYIQSKDINNTASQKRRLAGGQFSYALPYHKVTREIKYADIQPVITVGFTNNSDFYNETSYGLAPETGDRFRIVAPFTIYWGGLSASQIRFNGFGDYNAPLNYNIGRIRLRLRVRFEKSGNDLYMRRPLTGGSQVPFYQTWGSITAADVPVYYTDIYVNTTATWDDDGAADYYVIVSEPFDPTVDQWIQLAFDFVTPEVPNDCTAVHIYVQATYLLPDNSNLEFFTNNANFLTTSSTCSITGSLRVFPFDDYGLDSGIVLTATNEEDNRRTLDLGDSNVNDRALNSNYAVVKYREGNGFYQPCLIGYTSLLQATSQTYAADIAVQEAAGLYKTPKFVLEGNLVDYVVAFSDVLEITDGTTDYKLKPLTLEVNTGEEVIAVTAMQIAKESNLPDTLDSPIRTPLPPTPPPSVNVVQTLVSEVATQATTFSPSAEAYNANAGSANRSSQTGDQVAAINPSGEFVEVTDGTQGQVLSTDGSGVLSWASQLVQLASLSARVTAYTLSNYYYGNSSYGWNYPIWSGITFNNAQGNPYARQIADDYAHCAIVVTHDMSSVEVTGTIRNDSSTDDLDVLLINGTRPNGSGGNITCQVVGSTAVTVSLQDRHYNFTFTGGQVRRGELLFLGIARTAGTANVNRYINFTATIVGLKK